MQAIEHILRNNTSKDVVQEGNFAGDKLNENKWSVLREETLYGYGFDDLMLKISLMHLMMHEINNPNVEQKNTLSKKFDELNCYDVILANPLFKRSIDKFVIGGNFRTQTKKIELSFFYELFYIHNLNFFSCYFEIF